MDNTTLELVDSNLIVPYNEISVLSADNIMANPFVLADILAKFSFSEEHTIGADLLSSNTKPFSVVSLASEEILSPLYALLPPFNSK